MVPFSSGVWFSANVLSTSISDLIFSLFCHAHEFFFFFLYWNDFQMQQKIFDISEKYAIQSAEVFELRASTSMLTTGRDQLLEKVKDLESSLAETQKRVVLVSGELDESTVQIFEVFRISFFLFDIAHFH